jgi:two-component system copper resistance phosphate regulon response regulator CusR
LVVEDEAKLAANLVRGLGEAGFAVDVAPSAEAARASFSRNAYDLMLLDLRQPGQDGLEFLTDLRAAGAVLPVLILTARDSTDELVRGLDGGGDDYLTKPFALAELLARLRNLLKRHKPSSSEVTHVRVLDLELDILRREASRGGELLNLTQQEFVLLEYLCRNAGRVVTRSMILDQVWGMRIQPDTNVVDVHIYRLRGKVDTEGRQPLIRTLRGVGYVLKDR